MLDYLFIPNPGDLVIMNESVKCMMPGSQITVVFDKDNGEGQIESWNK